MYSGLYSHSEKEGKKIRCKVSGAPLQVPRWFFFFSERGEKQGKASCIEIPPPPAATRRRMWGKYSRNRYGLGDGHVQALAPCLYPVPHVWGMGLDRGCLWAGISPSDHLMIKGRYY